MKRFGKWLLPVAIISLLLTVLVGGSCAPQSLGEIFDPSGNPFAHRFSDVTDLRDATFIIAASNSEHKFEADYVCDGVDDHLQIQEAISNLPVGGGSIVLLDGLYLIEDTIDLCDGQTLRGQGWNTWLTTNTTDLIFISASDVGYITIRDLAIGGEGLSDAGIYFDTVDYSLISHVYSEGSDSPTGLIQTGIFLGGCSDCEVVDSVCRYNVAGVVLNMCVSCSVTNCRTFGNGDVGIYGSEGGITIADNTSLEDGFGIFLEGSDSTVTDNIVIEAGDTGIVISGTAIVVSGNCSNYSGDVGISVSGFSNVIEGNSCQDNGGNGIILDTSNGNTIADNPCQDNGGNGIILDTSNDNTIADNPCQGNGENGIYLYRSDGNTVTGNPCQGNSFTGIYLDRSDGNTVTGNPCQGNGENGIYLYSSDDNAVTGNPCQGNSHNGIFLHSSDDNTVTGNPCQGNAQGDDNTRDNIYLTNSDYNLIEGNLCRAPTIGTTLTALEPIGEDEIAVTNTDGFEVGMGVVIDLGGGVEEYHRIVAITAGAPGVITIDVGLTAAQALGETIDVPEARYGINISNATCDGNLVIDNDLYHSGKTAPFNDAGTDTRLNVYVVPFSDGTDPQDSGFLIDVGGEMARTWMRLPDNVHQVVRMKVYAVSVVAEADSMRLEFEILGGADNEPAGTHDGSVADHPSTSSNFAALDVIYWTITEAGVLALTGGDSVEIMVIHEIAGGADCATDAYIRTVEIEYV